MNMKRCLIHSYEHLDIEYDMLEMIAEELRSQGESYAADDVDEARKELLKVIFAVKKSWKFLEDPISSEQIKMDI